MSQSQLSIDDVWGRLKKFQGQEFETKRGEPFKYKVSGEVFRPSRTKYNISKADFGKALLLAPFDGPGVITKTIRGSSYVWAVLHDKRIRMQDW